MKKTRVAVFAAGLVVGAAAAYVGSALYFGNWPFAADVGLPEGIRPTYWAGKLDAAGAPNLHKVSAGLYRGAQPTAEGMRQLKAMGVRTVVNLRSLHSDRDELKGIDLAYVHIPMTAGKPSDKDVAAFLKVAADPARGPVFVHCKHGADRTGLMCAVYRLAVQGWTKDQAVAEMTRGGFGYHSYWNELVEYLRGLDVEAIRSLAGMEPASREGKGD